MWLFDLLDLFFYYFYLFIILNASIVISIQLASLRPSQSIIWVSALTLSSPYLGFFCCWFNYTGPVNANKLT